MTTVTETLHKYLQAAEAEGRSISDPEANLIETLATLPPETPAGVDVEARSAIATLRAEMQEQQPVVTASSPLSSMLPNSEGMNGLLTAIKSRQPYSVQAAAYSVQRPVDTVARSVIRLSDRLIGLGAGIAPVARKLEVPVIASGDAEIWTTGTKAEIVTELALVDAEVVAAWTEVTSMNFIDLNALEMQLTMLLGRRVVAVENVAVGESLLGQGTTATAAANAVEAVVSAILTASASGAGPNVLIMSSDIASAVMSSAQAGYVGLDDYWRGTLYGLPFHVVPGLTANRVIAADANALVIGRTPVLQLVDPYSGSKTNDVVLRTETSIAVAALDPTAVGICSVD